MAKVYSRSPGPRKSAGMHAYATLVIVTTARIFAANLRVASVRAPRSKNAHG